MARKSSFTITKSQLEMMHLDDGLTPKEISAKFGCSHSLILHYIKKYKIKKLPKFERIGGMKFGRLTAKNFVGIKNTQAMWDCVCECGNHAEVSTANLKFGKVQSCGCLLRARIVTHDLTQSRPYSIWRGMKTRCNNPRAINYSRYGGRGISYDLKWEDFTAFWNDMKDEYEDDLTLERLNNSKGYSKDNCIWVNYKAQNFNKRTNVFLSHQGKTQTITEWSKDLNINRRLLYYLHGEKRLSDDEIFHLVLKQNR